MEILVDTVNLDEIKKYQQMLHLSAVTSNPTIFKKEGRVDFFDHLRKIRDIIGTDETLHLQAVGDTTKEIQADAHRILQEIDRHNHLTIPTSGAGAHVMTD